MKLWTLVILLAAAASLCAAAAVLLAQRAGLDPYMVAYAAMFSAMAAYAARQAMRKPALVMCNRCGTTDSDPMLGFCIRCGHVPRSAARHG